VATLLFELTGEPVEEEEEEVEGGGGEEEVEVEHGLKHSSAAGCKVRWAN